MKVTLDSKSIQYINLFMSITNSSIVDFIEDNGDLYFVVKEGQYGLAVGRNGMKIKRAEHVFKKSIKVFEYAPDLEQFVKNLVPEAQTIDISGSEIVVRIKPGDRARVIGRNGKNVKIIKQFLEHLFEVQSFKVK
jgi:N utilization substance protein A